MVFLVVLLVHLHVDRKFVRGFVLLILLDLRSASIWLVVVVYDRAEVLTCIIVGVVLGFFRGLLLWRFFHDHRAIFVASLD